MRIPARVIIIYLALVIVHALHTMSMQGASYLFVGAVVAHGLVLNLSIVPLIIIFNMGCYIFHAKHTPCIHCTIIILNGLTIAPLVNYLN